MYSHTKTGKEKNEQNITTHNGVDKQDAGPNSQDEMFPQTHDLFIYKIQTGGKTNELF